MHNGLSIGLLKITYGSKLCKNYSTHVKDTFRYNQLKYFIRSLPVVQIVQ